MTTKATLTEKQTLLLSNLSDKPKSQAHELVKGIVSNFNSNKGFTPAHVIGSMLQFLSNKGLCYVVQQKKKKKYWSITELGVYTLFNEVSLYE